MGALVPHLIVSSECGCMYVCVRVCAAILVHMHVYVCVCVFARMHIYIYESLSVHTQVLSFVCSSPLFSKNSHKLKIFTAKQSSSSAAAALCWTACALNTERYSHFARNSDLFMSPCTSVHRLVPLTRAPHSCPSHPSHLPVPPPASANLTGFFFF